MLGEVEGDFRHEPLEVLALEVASDGELLAHVARLHRAVRGSAFVDELRVFVHPHFSHSLVVL